MNSAFVGYEELSRSRRVLSASVDNTLQQSEVIGNHKTDTSNRSLK